MDPGFPTGAFWFELGQDSLAAADPLAQQPLLDLEFLNAPPAAAEASNAASDAQPKKRKGGRKPLTAEQKEQRKEKVSV